MDAQILARLREGDAASGTDLAQSLGISRAAIWARIEDLRRLGYEITASPHEGYRLLSVPDVLHADDLLSRLPPDVIVGRDIRVFQETTSTNDIVERLARDGVPEGAVVFAESQSRGRGRLGRKWISPASRGLWFSVLLRPQLSPQETTQLTVASATALCRAIKALTGLQPKIKWPNDILINGRKVCGILTELRAEPDSVQYVILGIGVDVNLTAGEFPADLRKLATSLKLEAGRAIPRADLASAILLELDRDYGRIRRHQFERVADEWEAQCATLGSHVTLQIGSRTLQGRVEALDQDGALLLRTQHGRLERVLGGDITMHRADTA